MISNRTILKKSFYLISVYIVRLFKIKHILLITSIIALTIILNSKMIETIQAQITDPELKHVLDKAKTLAFNVMNDENKDKVFSAPSDIKGLWDICNRQAENNPKVSNTEQ